MRIRLRRGRVYASVALLLPSLLVSSALGFAVRVPGVGLLPRLPGTSPLDYLSRPNHLAPLSERFIASVLGVRTDEPSRGGERVRPVTRGAVSSDVSAERITDEHPLTNDDIRDARYVPSVPFTAKTDTREATRETNEPGDCSPVGDSTVWYRYRPQRDVGLIANTFGSDYSTILGIFRGRPGALTEIACDRDAGGNAIAPFPAKAKTTYYFQIVGPVGGGRLVFNLDPQGTTTEEPASVPDFPTISGDGRLVAYAGGSQFDSRPYAHADCGSCLQVHVLDLRTKGDVLASVSSLGEPGNAGSNYPMISGTGRYVAFESDATNLVRGDTNGETDVFVHDLVTGRTERVSVGSDGRQIPSDPARQWDGAQRPAISSDGRFVLFETLAALVPDDYNGISDLYIRDRLLRKTERVSVGWRGQERGPEAAQCGPDAPFTCSTNGTFTQFNSALSPDGHLVRFSTSSPNLVPDDTNGYNDTFVRDRVARTTERVSVTSSGKQAENADGAAFEISPRPAFSRDGRFVVFTSYAALQSDDTNDQADIYVHDRWTRKTFRVDLSSSGRQTDADSRGATITPDGRYVGFHSDSGVLTPGDTNEQTDVFVRDILTGTTVRVSVTPTGEASDGSAAEPAMSDDGRTVVFIGAGGHTRGSFSLLPTDALIVYERARSSP